MKSYHYSIFITFLTIILFTSCNKDDQFLLRIDPMAKGLSVNKKINFILDSSPMSDTLFIIDIDNDGINDIEFCSKYYLSSSGSTYKYSSVKTLNDSTEIAIFEKTDSVFSYWIHWPDGDSSYQYTNYHPNNPYNPPITTINKNYPFPFSLYNILDENSNWKNGIFTLSEEKTQGSEGYPLHPDIREYNFGIWNNIVNKFIGIKTTNNKTSYGWIKLQITNHKKIKFYGYALKTFR